MTLGAAPSDIVVIGGPPGAGKTRLAARLAVEFPSGVHLEADHFFRFVVSGYVEPWRRESDAQNHVVNTAVARAASAYADGEYTVVIDGINGPWFLEHLIAQLAPLPGTAHYVIVTCDVDVAIARIHDRADRAAAEQRYGRDIDDAAVRFMHEQFITADTGRFQVLDTTSTSEEQTFAECRALLHAGRLQLVR